MQNKRPYYKQKIRLYFDENFPISVVEGMKKIGWLLKICKIYSVADFDNVGKDDKYQSAFCKKKGFILVTLDNDFMNDKDYPFGNIPGIILIKEKSNNAKNAALNFVQLLSFLSRFPFPKDFVDDCKFQAWHDKCSVRGRDKKTMEIKEMLVDGKISVSDVMKYFHHYE